jgi:hypothetical protein
MNRNLSARFRRIAAPNALLELIDRETERLQCHYTAIRSFSIFVERISESSTKNTVRAQVVIGIPGNRIVASRETDGMQQKENAALAVELAFQSAESMMNRATRRRRGNAEEKSNQDNTADADRIAIIPEIG